MTSYKKVAEEQAKQIGELKNQIESMCELDKMTAALTNDDAKQVLAMFAERAQNRAELVLLIRVLSKL